MTMHLQPTTPGAAMLACVATAVSGCSVADAQASPGDDARITAVLSCDKIDRKVTARAKGTTFLRNRDIDVEFHVTGPNGSIKFKDLNTTRSGASGGWSVGDPSWSVPAGDGRYLLVVDTYRTGGAYIGSASDDCEF